LGRPAARVIIKVPDPSKFSIVKDSNGLSVFAHIMEKGSEPNQLFVYVSKPTRSDKGNKEKIPFTEEIADKIIEGVFSSDKRQ
jgi:hypothetical protein